MTWTPCRIMVGVVMLSGAAVSEARGADESLLGSRVRVRTIQPGEPQVGVLEGATPDELVLRTEAAASAVQVRRSDVVRLEVSRGTRRNTLKGLMGGAIAWGAIVGLVAAFDTLDESGVGEPLFVGGLLAAGAGVGSLVKTERWERVPANGVSVGIGPSPRGVQARIVVRF
jgi:hypothetical protein